MASVISTTADLKVPPAKLWETITARESVLPKLSPEIFASMEYIEGDGGVGTIRLVKFGPALESHQLTFSKEKLEVVDHATKTLAYSVVDGELLKLYKTYKITVKVDEGAEPSSSVVNWSLEYEAISPEIPAPQAATDGATNTFKAIEAYLLANP
eukprot:c34403_g1_i1 orf=261-725(+)